VSLWSDLKILTQMAFKPVRGGTHAERLESFYGGQARDYDDFRRRLLKGREHLWDVLPRPDGGIWVDMGGGTGANLENFGPGIDSLGKVYVVDLSRSLLTVARDRCRQRGWSNVECVEADATTFRPAEGSADVVTFSYSLTMIPPWHAAIDNALAMLKPGGLIGVVDFYVAQKHPAETLRRHGWLCRSLWPVWFATDNVFPSPDHLPYLRRKFETVRLEEEMAKLPYVPLLRAPYYTFIGQKA
jgi:S-adenosylmethionine-diacylgycerolhomoserine-N-methlytransferase